MNAMQSFQFEDHAVRMLVRDDEPWWVMTDVCRVLDMQNRTQAAGRLDADEKGVCIIDTLGGSQEMTIINESGLYSLILTSRKPAAKRFKKWVTSELLPTLRRTGRYVLDDDEEEGWPVSADRKVFGISIAKANAAARLISTANRIYGPEAARALWAQEKGLPDVARFGVNALVGTAEDDPEGCLRHLFNANTGKSVPLREVLGAALATGKGAADLPKYGLVLDPEEAPGYVAVAHTSRFLAAAFAETQWCLEWDLALMKLDGARAGKQLEIAGTRTRTVLLPRETLIKALSH